MEPDMNPIPRGVQIGVDIGQKQDPTAIVIAEVQLRGYALVPPALGPERDRRHYEHALVHGRLHPGLPLPRPTAGETCFIIRDLGRLALGTPYPEVVARILSVRRALGDKRVTVYVDATGVGQPIVDELHKAGLQSELRAVYLTGGERETREGNNIKFPKMLLVSRLKVLLQTGRIVAPRTPEIQALAGELESFETRFTEAANLQFGAFKTGKHDDLVVALGLATREPPPESRVESRVSVGKAQVREMFG